MSEAPAQVKTTFVARRPREAAGLDDEEGLWLVRHSILQAGQNPGRVGAEANAMVISVETDTMLGG